MPHLVSVGIATIFNWLAFALNKKGFALVAGILYSVSIVLILLAIFNLVIQTVLCYVAYAKLGKQQPLS